MQSGRILAHLSLWTKAQVSMVRAQGRSRVKSKQMFSFWVDTQYLALAVRWIKDPRRCAVAALGHRSKLTYLYVRDAAAAIIETQSAALHISSGHVIIDQHSCVAMFLTDVLMMLTFSPMIFLAGADWGGEQRSLQSNSGQECCNGLRPTQVHKVRHRVPGGGPWEAQPCDSDKDAFRRHYLLQGMNRTLKEKAAFIARACNVWFGVVWCEVLLRSQAKAEGPALFVGDDTRAEQFYSTSLAASRSERAILSQYYRPDRLTESSCLYPCWHAALPDE